MSARRKIGEYRIVTGLGSGGMARVYLGMTEQNGFKKLVVLKVLRTELEDPSFVEMFQNEAQLAARLNHPHVVQTNAFGEDDGCHFMAMEYLEGQALSTLIGKLRGEGGIPIELHVRILCDALDGLDYAHKLADFDGTPLRLVHRDVSPQNIFVTYTGQAKVLDFGIAKVSNSSVTSTGIIKGKASYMAPEQFRGLPLDCRADVFAVGVMLWEAMANRRFVQKGIEDVAVLARRVDGDEPRIREIMPDAPEGLANACDRALSVAPGDRFASASDMRDALETWLRTRDHVDARQIAALLDGQFSTERSRLRKLVEDQIKNIDSPDSIYDIRKQALGTPARGDSPDTGSDIRRQTPRTPARIDQSDSAASLPNEARTIVAIPPRAAKRPYAAIALVAAAVVGGAIMLRGRTGSGGAAVAPPASVAAPVTPAGAAASNSAAPKRVEVKLDITPRDARIFLDGHPLSSNPYAGSLPADGSRHELRVEAEGYSPEVRSVALDADLNVIVQLEKLPALPASAPIPALGPMPGNKHAPAASAHAPVALPTAPTAPTAPAAPTASAPAGKPAGPLDWKDPWSH
jgi:serine/threonine-protein kinase